MEDKLVIDRETFKALAVDTRLNILKLLITKSYTLTEIAEILKLQNSTVKEHLDTLVKAGLIKKEDTDRKWKYYSITMKGRRIIQPREVRVLFAFVTTLIAAAAVAIAFWRRFSIVPKGMIGTEAVAEESARLMVATDMPQKMLAGAAPAPAATSVTPLLMLISFIVLVGLSALFLGMLIRKPAFVLSHGGEKR